jgi:hypothetical protein
MTSKVEASNIQIGLLIGTTEFIKAKPAKKSDHTWQYRLRCTKSSSYKTWKFHEARASQINKPSRNQRHSSKNADLVSYSSAVPALP